MGQEIESESGLKCPTCGGELLQQEEVLLDEELNLVVVRGERVKLTGREFEVLNALVSRMPRPISKALLMDEIYGLFGGEEPVERILDVFVCRVRKKLRDTPLNIETVWGKGYRAFLGQVETHG